MSLLPSNSRPRGWPISPPRSRALWASRAAAHSSRSRTVRRHSPALSTCLKCCARKPRHRARVPAGGSSMRIRL
eukprot:3040035-Pleurochrysis_carterae.AAC.1